MPFEQQVDKLITRLTELTAQQKVAWQETAREDTYLAPLGKFIVTVGRAAAGAYGGYLLQINDNHGRTVEEALGRLVGPDSPSYQVVLQEWERLRSLHELARRSALKSDEVVSDLLSSLEQIH
jgi:hypothetical protein